MVRFDPRVSFGDTCLKVVKAWRGGDRRLDLRLASRTGVCGVRARRSWLGAGRGIFLPLPISTLWVPPKAPTSRPFQMFSPPGPNPSRRVSTLSSKQFLSSIFGIFSFCLGGHGQAALRVRPPVGRSPRRPGPETRPATNPSRPLFSLPKRKIVSRPNEQSEA